MSFSIDDGWDTCTPVARAGNAAFGVYCRCGAWSARNSTDGFIPAEVALGIGSPELASKLASVGLWEAVEGGWSMPHYLERNESADQVRARRKREADRKAEWRARLKALSHGDTTRTGRGRPTGQTPDVRSSFTPPKGGSRAPSSATPAPIDCKGFLDDGTKTCKRCGLPRMNRAHYKRVTPDVPRDTESA